MCITLLSIISRIQVDDGSTYDISQMEAVPPDATVEYDEDGNPIVTSLSYVFTGWSSTAGSTLETSDDPDSRTEISNTNVTVNSDMEFYPVFRLSHWLNFYSAPTGSGATYLLINSMEQYLLIQLCMRIGMPVLQM